ncbi:DNA cytosine methyltransferase [Nitratireductor sp.]|uniref:DNA cytosine methyltransferase n=1 Tax=Nitratireductor sp. TaxID=1872084 RepID=UPI00263586DE|nr:DNA (cytosine-5-)-methyltransferase [Nitratireductor sp.]MCV0381745.1 DNA cytosine methyltransferase [Nitratireductor sp.]
MLQNTGEAYSGPMETVQTRPEPSRIYSMIDLFAGCGGLSLGFENSGFTPIFVNELDDDARASYLLNRRHSLGGERFADNKELHSRDAHELKGKRLEKLVSDLSGIRELDIRFDKTSRPANGGGSSIDILAGGPPCQGYSGIGIRRSYAVDKKELPSNRLYVRMANVIRRVRPRIFLFENVRGLLNSRWTRDGEDDFIFPDVEAEFRNIPGYEVRWSLVFAKDYGVPQNRPRVLLVGIRKDVVEACPFLEPAADPSDAVKCGFLPAGEPGSFPDLVDLLGDLIDNSVAETLRSGDFGHGRFESTRYPRAARTKIQKLLRQPPSWEPGRRVLLTEQEYSKHRKNIVEKFEYMLLHDGEIPPHHRTKKFSQRVLKPRWGNCEPNITATSLPDDYVHFSQPRILTVREWARLQLFPDWYQFAGKRTTGGLRRAGNPLEGNFDREAPKYTQIGNAVPVGLAEKVGAHFRLVLDAALGSHA